MDSDANQSTNQTTVDSILSGGVHRSVVYWQPAGYWLTEYLMAVSYRLSAYQLVADCRLWPVSLQTGLWPFRALAIAEAAMRALLIFDTGGIVYMKGDRVR